MSEISSPIVSGDPAMQDALNSPPPLPPAVPGDGAADWIKKNLFGSISGSIVTLLFMLVAYLGLQWISDLVITEDRDWTSVWTNMRLLFTYTYPSSDGQYLRIWVSLGTVLAFVTMTLAALDTMPRVGLRKITNNIVSAGAVMLILAFVQTVRLFSIQSPGKAVGYLFFLGLLLVIGGLATQRAMGIDSLDERSVPVLHLIMVFAAAVVAFLWLVPFGRYESVGNEVFNDPGTVNRTTKVPWTFMMGLLVGGYYFGRAVRSVLGEKPYKMLLGLWWVAGPAFLVFLVLRDPKFDWGHVTTWDIPMALLFAVGGGALLYALSKPGSGELAKAVGAGILVFAAFNWLAAYFGWGWYPFSSILQKTRISLLLLSGAALLAPNFAGELRARIRFAAVWAGFILLLHVLITSINTDSELNIVQPPFLGGFTLTLVIAYYVMLASFPIGIIMALARTSKLPLFRVMSTGYVELVRGIPLITVLFFFAKIVNLFLPGDMEISQLGAVFLGYSLFSGAYMAENIRGGLQAVRTGQFEASDALGLTGVQRTAFIVLPQAMRVSIPNLVGQAIATFKETSLIAIIGGFDFLNVANKSIPSQPNFLGQNLAALLFISAIYWMISYTMSRSSRSLEEKLGVGAR